MKFFLIFFLIGCGILVYSVFDLVMFYFYSEEEEVEEVEEDKDKDSLSSVDLFRNVIFKILFKFLRIVDFGVVVNYGKFEVINFFLI